MEIILEKYDTKEVYTSTTFYYEDGKVELFLHDFGKNVESFFGEDEYEAWHRLNEIDSEKFMKHLDLLNKTESEAKTILKEKLCREGGAVNNFLKICASLGLKIDSNSWV